MVATFAGGKSRKSRPGIRTWGLWCRHPCEWMPTPLLSHWKTVILGKSPTFCPHPFLRTFRIPHWHRHNHCRLLCRSKSDPSTVRRPKVSPMEIWLSLFLKFVKFMFLSAFTFRKAKSGGLVPFLMETCLLLSGKDASAQQTIHEALKRQTWQKIAFVYQVLSGSTSVYPCASMATAGTDTAAAKKHTETIAAANRWKAGLYRILNFQQGKTLRFMELPLYTTESIFRCAILK